MIKDKVVIITGASAGIGEATAKLLASKGAKVVLGARRADKLERIVGEITSAGGHAVFQELDVTKQSDNDAIVELAKNSFGRLDVTFLNAGLMPNSMLSALKPAIGTRWSTSTSRACSTGSLPFSRPLSRNSPGM